MNEPRLTFREYQQLEAEFRDKKKLKIKNPKAKLIKRKKTKTSKKSRTPRFKVIKAANKLGYWDLTFGLMGKGEPKQLPPTGYVDDSCQFLSNVYAPRKRNVL